jgi:hypothetical protein
MKSKSAPPAGRWLAAAAIWLVSSGFRLHAAPSSPLAAAAPNGLIFVVRKPGSDPHWYANFGQYAPDRLAASPVFTRGASLRRLDPVTGAVTVLLDDPQGGIRDPQLHHDGHTILFSYRPGNSEHYHLYEIGIDGSGLRRLTDGPFDDIEPVYLPDGGIVFVSSRCKRWVNCWLTPVATLHRCDAEGGNIRSISLNIEHDNTPWVMPDGRILYTRWEYVDRSQVHYHHLWSMNPDGTAPMTWFGNLHPGVVMIDAKPVPNSQRVVCIFSPGHGQKEHAGTVALVDPSAGPDEARAAVMLTRTNDYRDPWAFSESLVLAARGGSLVLLENNSETRILQLDEAERKAGFQCHEPRPAGPRKREHILADRAGNRAATGTMYLMDASLGRNMAGVPKDGIRRLMVLESLPKPVNFTGGMEPLSYGGTFTLERVLGSVPVEPDGSAHFEVPAGRSLFFVALDANERAVKRMQSFTGVQPGERLGCVGCHEHRETAPPHGGSSPPLAMRRPPSVIEPYRGVPDVLDFPRDIQPILDRHCVKCHQPSKADGGVILTGDRGPMYSHSYVSLTIHHQLADGRNAAQSNYPPYALGSGSSGFLRSLEGGHHDVKADAIELLKARLWIDSGAPYPGTYAALGTGMIGGYEMNEQVIENDHAWPETRNAAAAIGRRCTACHDARQQPLPKALSDEIGFSFWMPNLKDRRIRRNRHLVFNLTRPDQSLMLLAPLARAAGGLGTCREPGTTPGDGTVFSNNSDPDYQAILAMCSAGKRRLDGVKRFDMPGFRPRREWIAEMKRFSVLPASFDEARDPVDPYATEQAYWRSLWPVPSE